MAKMPKEALDMLNDLESSKVLATVDREGRVNAVPVGSLMAADDETILFAEIFLQKTKSNLETTGKASVLVFKALDGYQIKGKFLGFQTSGELFEQTAKRVKELLGLEIKSVGTIRVEEVYSVGPPEPGKRLV